jgi:MFS family permease
MAACALLGLTQVRPVVHRTAISNGETIEFLMLIRPAAVLIMLGIGLFEAANNMHFTFSERIGFDRGLLLTTVGEILGISTVIGIPAAFAVVWLGDRYGEAKPIGAALALAIAGLALLLWSESPSAYVSAMCLLSIAWAFGLPYFQAFEARLDPGGSVVVAGGFFTAAGAMLGPALAAMLVMPGNYSGVLGVAIGIYLLVGMLVRGAARFSAK